MSRNVFKDVQLHDTITAASLDAISRAMLVAWVRETFELPEPTASKLIEVGEQLLEHRFRMSQVPGHYIGESDNARFEKL